MLTNAAGVVRASSSTSSTAAASASLAASRALVCFAAAGLTKATAATNKVPLSLPTTPRRAFSFRQVEINVLDGAVAKDESYQKNAAEMEHIVSQLESRVEKVCEKIILLSAYVGAYGPHITPDNACRACRSSSAATRTRATSTCSARSSLCAIASTR